MKKLLLLLTLLGLAGCWPASSEDPELTVRKKIAHMAAEDQALRHYLLDKGFIYQLDKHPAFKKQQAEMFAKHTQELKNIVKQWGWPTISKFGHMISTEATVLVQHSEDLAFQQECLDLMQKALEQKDINPVDFAYLWDEVQVKQGKPQRYGSQIEVVDGVLKGVKPLEDPEHVDEQRKSVGLEPLADYLKFMKQRHNLK